MAEPRHRQDGFSPAARAVISALVLIWVPGFAYLAQQDMAVSRRGMRGEMLHGFLPVLLLLAVVVLTLSGTLRSHHGRHVAGRGKRRIRIWTSASTSSPGH